MIRFSSPASRKSSQTFIASITACVPRISCQLPFSWISQLQTYFEFLRSCPLQDRTSSNTHQTALRNLRRPESPSCDNTCLTPPGVKTTLYENLALVHHRIKAVITGAVLSVAREGTEDRLKNHFGPRVTAQMRCT